MKEKYAARFRLNSNTENERPMRADRCVRLSQLLIYIYQCYATVRYVELHDRTFSYLQYSINAIPETKRNENLILRFSSDFMRRDFVASRSKATARQILNTSEETTERQKRYGRGYRGEDFGKAIFNNLVDESALKGTKRDGPKRGRISVDRFFPPLPSIDRRVSVRREPGELKQAEPKPSHRSFLPRATPWSDR